MKFVLLILGCILSNYAIAGIYKCTDNSGNTKYLSKPCAEGDKNIEINLKTGSKTDLDEKQSEEESKKNQELAKSELEKLEEQAKIKKQELLFKAALDESKKNQIHIKNNPQQYSAFAIPPYLPTQLSALVKIHQDRLPDIERMRRQASEKALQSDQCTRVESSELNNKSTKDALVFYIICSSGKNLYISEQELAQP
jgi:hypothetical protein